jgi:unsaturated rhamnogalacturonyl hydrolase
MAKTSMSEWAVTGPAKDRFQYELGVFLRGIELVWEETDDKKYFDYIKFKVDRFVAENGTINYNATQLTLDDILTGRLVLTLYEKTRQVKYKKAAKQLIEQLKVQPRTKEGGFWHKLVYPYQMWLDGLYMAEPFYAEYAKIFHEPPFFHDVAKQFILMEKRSRDSKTGLLYHGYDESRVQKWSDPKTGRSPSFWGRSIGWYFMGLVDTLEFFPAYHPKRAPLLAILNRLAVAVQKVQDPKSGLWWQVLDKPYKKGNYLESSASAMFVYSYARGVRKGYLPKKYLKTAVNGYAGIVKNFIVKLPDGGLNYTRIASVGGLGGTPYRNGTFEYYISEPIATNDPKGVGPFMMASVEISYVQ